MHLFAKFRLGSALFSLEFFNIHVSIQEQRDLHTKRDLPEHVLSTLSGNKISRLSLREPPILSPPGATWRNFINLPDLSDSLHLA